MAWSCWLTVTGVKIDEITLETCVCVGSMYRDRKLMTLSSLNTSSWFKILRRYYQFKRLCRNSLRLEKRVFVQDRTEFYREMWSSAAEQIGASFTPLTQTIWDVSYRGQHTRLDLYCTELDNPVTLNVVGDKAPCHKILSDGGLPVPDHLLLSPDEISKAHEFVRNHQGYFVVKPAAGTSAARGITTFVRSPGDCTKAIANASLYSQQVLIERIVPGELYRLLVLQDEVIHAIRRPGIRIKGDGESSIAKLAIMNCGVHRHR